MLSVINSLAENSQTIKEARENVQEKSFIEDIVIFIVLFIVALIALAVFQAIFGIFHSEDNTPLGFFFTHTAYIALPIMVLIFASKIEKRSFRSVGLSKGNVLPSVLKGILFGFILILSILILNIATGQLIFKGIDFSIGFSLLLYLVAYAVQSFGEEIICRGWALTYLSKRHGIVFAICLSNILFVIPHMGVQGFDLLAAINIFLIGLLFSIIFLKYDNVWIAGATHATWNFLLGPIFGLDVSGNATLSLLSFTKASPTILNGGNYGPESSLIVTIVVVIALLVAFYFLKKSE